MSFAARLCLTILALAVAASPATAVDDDVRAARTNDRGGLFAQLFPRREQAPTPPGQVPGAVTDPSELVVRIDRLEATIRQLTGMIEQLQFRNQQMEQQLRRMQEDVEYRLSGTAPAGPRPAARTPGAPAAMPPVTAPAPATPGRRADVFDPTQSPNAPGAPRPLGTMPGGPPPAGPNMVAGPAPDAAPTTRPTGAPLDLTPGATTVETPRGPGPIGRPLTPGPQATLPPSDSAKDAYDLAYGYLLRRDYDLAMASFKKFLGDFPNDRLAPDAYYGLGESMFQRQQYRDSAEHFLKISTDYPNAPRAAEALLRLGQSLAALDERETACAAFGEVGRKYPRASAAVKQAVVQEQRRAKC